MVKLNTFHWHITDSQSFPIILKSHPNLAKFGAYGRDKVYTADDVADIIQYARVRGIRVLPEFDQPAHVGEGWQHTNLTTCFNMQPWAAFCVEPPCGQFDPTKDELYNVLEDIYRDLVELFKNPDLFHMGSFNDVKLIFIILKLFISGGDEVHFGCWNSSKPLQQWMQAKGWGLEESDFMKLWNYFQERALKRLDKVSKEKVPIIMWTSKLTEVPYLTQYLDPMRYIIQVWTLGDDPKIQTLLEEGFNVIISNYDALYLDCGFGGWVTNGNNWCSPYIGWHKVYENDLKIIAGSRISQVHGAEAALWTEQIDEYSLDGRLWPRTSALAERLWSDPKDSWKYAESRMLVNRKRLVENGIAADRLEPEWCLENEGECPI